jgi:O-antigen/teichoic acid export membrane protein
LPPIVTASGTYFAAQALLLLAGLISMPVTTRLLSKSEYGLLSVAFTAAAVLSLIGRLGLGDAALRLYSEYRQQTGARLRELCESLLSGTFIASALVALGVAVAIGRPGGEWSPVVVLVAVLVLVRAVSTVVFEIQRAQERAFAYALSQLGIRYGTTVVAVAAMLVWARTAVAVIAAALLVEVAMLGWRLAELRRQGLIVRPRLSPALRAALSYGLPLALAGSARYVLDYGDRLLIERMLGLEAVAIYSVPYDLSHRLGDALMLPVQLAAVPLLFRLWGEKGPEAASRMASQVLTYVIALGAPVVVLYLLYNQAVIVLLASTKYAASSDLTPYLLPGILLERLSFVVVVGLTVQKRTVSLALILCAAAMLNLILNLLLIPLWHLTGAAIATTTAYAAMFMAQYWMSRTSIRLRVDGVVVAKAAAATAAALALLSVTDRIGSSGVADLAISVVAGGAAAFAVFALLDARLRRVLRPLPWTTRRETDATSG